MIADQPRSTPTANQDQPRLVISDLDGTLLSAPGERYAQAMLEALEATIGPHPRLRLQSNGLELDGSIYDGKIDAQLFREALRIAGHDRHAVERLLPSVCRAMERTHARLHGSARRSTRRLAGTVDALQRLQAGGVHLALVTGNIGAIADRKCVAAGLAHFFPVRACGDRAHERADLIDEAITRAGAFHGVDFSRDDVLYVGDTQNDVVAAKRAGVPCAAVASGRWSRAQLAAVAPTLLHDDLSSAVGDILAFLGRRGAVASMACT